MTWILLNICCLIVYFQFQRSSVQHAEAHRITHRSDWRGEVAALRRISLLHTFYRSKYYQTLLFQQKFRPELSYLLLEIQEQHVEKLNLLPASNMTD